MSSLGAARDRARLDDVAEQAEVNEVEMHKEPSWLAKPP
jgi:hypothetical protein